MRNIRSLVLGLVLVSLSPLGWGEDVYYCIEEHNVDLAPTDSGDAYELKRYKTEPFTFKYEPDAKRLAIKGRNWGGEDFYYMDCEQCLLVTAYFDAVNSIGRFSMKDSRFFYASASFSRSNMATGTCTKF